MGAANFKFPKGAEGGAAGGADGAATAGPAAAEEDDLYA